MRTRTYLNVAVALTTVLAGCGTTPVGSPQLLAFLNDGTTTREDVFMHLAEPSATFEGGRILTYLLDQDAGGYILMRRREKVWNGKFSLVLAFDEHGVLRRHALVRIRAYPGSP